MPRVALLSLLAALLVVSLVGCGSDDETAAVPGTRNAAAPAATGDPERVVTEFVRLAGTPSHDAVMSACKLLSPDIREGMRFEESVKASERDCVSALGLELYYTGDTGEVAPPKSFTGTVTGANVTDDRAVVSVRMSYQLDSGAKTYDTKTLAVRSDGDWWVATPSSLNVLRAMSGVDEAELAEVYQQHLDAAAKARAQHEAGEEAARDVQEGLDGCPSDGASAADDARGDVKYADGMRQAEQQPGEADLVAVLHNADGDRFCFELQFAGAPPEEGAVELTIRPRGGRMTAQWTSDRRVIGQRTDTSDAPVAVQVDASRGDDAMTLRVPRSAFSDTGGEYRWAVELVRRVPGDDYKTYYDSVPDDLTVYAERDKYIPHPG